MRGLCVVCLVACSSHGAAPPPLAQDAYVWQRDWSPAVRDAVASAPVELAGLRVLAAEVAAPEPELAPALAVLPLDAHALAAAHRPITLVVRIAGARPIAGLSLAPIAAAAQRWIADGVDIIGVEIDHDCATARLHDYATWLATARPRGLRFSITALPTWATSPDALAEVAATVDEVVVQVHAVRAPAIFDPDDARRDLARFAAVLDNHVRLRVALPTYRATVGGASLEVDPAIVAAFADDLARAPIAGVTGLVWFRLPIGDGDTWSAQTFAAVVAHAPVAAPIVRVELRERGAGRFDIVATNASDRAAELPAVRVDGELDAAELVAGYTSRGDLRWAPPHRALAAGAAQAIGWARGKAPHVEIE